MKPLEYRSPMKDKYLDVGKIDCGGWEIATMLTTDDLISCDLVTYKYGSDGGGLQLEIDEIGEKLVRAYNSHDDLLAAIKKAVDGGCVWKSGADLVAAENLIARAKGGK